MGITLGNYGMTSFLAENSLLAYNDVELYFISLTSLALSLAVNAIVTALIVFKIFKMYLEGKRTLKLKLRGVGSSRIKQAQSVIFIIIESGMALFAIQLVRICMTVLQATPGFKFIIGANSYRVIIGIHQMFNGIIPTIIFVRVSMKLSFHDHESLVKAISNLQSPPHNPDPIPVSEEVGDTDHVGRERICDIDIQESEEINIEQR